MDPKKLQSIKRLLTLDQRQLTEIERAENEKLRQILNIKRRTKMRNAKYWNWGEGKSTKWDYADEVEIPRFDTPEDAADDYLQDMEKFGYCGQVEISGYYWDENFQAWEKSEDYFDFCASQEAYDREEERRIYGTE